MSDKVIKEAIIKIKENITNLQKQLNKEMKKNRFIGHGVRSDVDKFQLGYETENISPANYD